jgi:hypothetical protein
MAEQSIRSLDRRQLLTMLAVTGAGVLDRGHSSSSGTSSGTGAGTR